MADGNTLNDARDYRADATMLDGSAIQVHAIRPDDKQRLLEHFHGLSQKSVYLRFMGIRRELSADDLKRLTEIDFKTHVGLVATLTQESRERFIGVGRYICGNDPTRAEVAFAILDDFQGRGIGTILLQHLARIANANGVEEFEADVLGENRQMLEVFAHSGFARHQSLESGVVHLRASTRALLKK